MNKDKIISILKWLAKKLGSRKFLLGLTGAITGLILAFKGTPETAETVSGIILAIASIVAYILGEALADSAHANDENKE